MLKLFLKFIKKGGTNSVTINVDEHALNINIKNNTNNNINSNTNLKKSKIKFLHNIFFIL